MKPFLGFPYAAVLAAFAVTMSAQQDVVMRNNTPSRHRDQIPPLPETPVR